MEEVDEAFSFDCNYGNELIVFVLMVTFVNRVEDGSVGGFFLE